MLYIVRVSLDQLAFFRPGPYTIYKRRGEYKNAGRSSTMIHKTYLSTQRAANRTHIPIVQSYRHVDYILRTSVVVEEWGDLSIACEYSPWPPRIIIS
jgi:hypothetical protein